MSWEDAQPVATPVATHHEHLVVGPPGCGKTHYVARQVERAASTYRRDSIAVVSLTKAAAAEAAGRTNLGPTQVGTLHSFAYRALERPQVAESTKGIRAWNEQAQPNWRLTGAMIGDVENAAAELVAPDSDGDSLLAHLGVLRAGMVDESHWPAAVQEFGRAWRSWQAEDGWTDFTGLIERCIDEVPQMPGQPWVVFADEAQDMSRLEMELLRKWGQYTEQLVLVGDPDQALYTWRGADPDSVFGTDPEQVIVLHQSFRCPRAVVKVATDWISRMHGRLPISYEPRDHDGEVTHSAYGWKEPAGILAQARLDLEAGRTVMVLATCGYMLGPFTKAARLAGVPFQNPYRPGFHPWNPLNNAHRLLSFLRPLGDAWGDDSRLWTWDDLRRWTDVLTAKGALTRGSKSLIEAKVKEGRFGADDTQANDVVGLATLQQLFEPDAYEAILNTDVEWWARHLKHVDAQRQEFSLDLYRAAGPKVLHRRGLDHPDGPHPKLFVGSIHSVKGGQADSVYLIPDLSPTGYWDGLKLEPQAEAHKSILRQIYVGMTRARDKLTLCTPSTGQTVEW